MSARTVGGIAFLALLGIVVAAGIGLLTNAIAGDSIGLSANSLQPGRQLAPPQAREERDRHRHEAQSRHQPSTTTTTAPATTTTTTAVPTTTVPPATTTTSSGELEPGDDHGGSSGSSGPGGGGLDD